MKQQFPNKKEAERDKENPRYSPEPDPQQGGRFIGQLGTCEWPGAVAIGVALGQEFAMWTTRRW